jgi:hypothetical protein
VRALALLCWKRGAKGGTGGGFRLGMVLESGYFKDKD